VQSKWRKVEVVKLCVTGNNQAQGKFRTEIQLAQGREGDHKWGR